MKSSDRRPRRDAPTEPRIQNVPRQHSCESEAASARTLRSALKERASRLPAADLCILSLCPHFWALSMVAATACVTSTHPRASAIGGVARPACGVAETLPLSPPPRHALGTRVPRCLNRERRQRPALDCWEAKLQARQRHQPSPQETGAALHEQPRALAWDLALAEDLQAEQRHGRISAGRQNKAGKFCAKQRRTSGELVVTLRAFGHLLLAHLFLLLEGIQTVLCESASNNNRDDMIGANRCLLSAFVVNDNSTLIAGISVFSTFTKRPTREITGNSPTREVSLCSVVKHPLSLARFCVNHFGKPQTGTQNLVV